MVRTDPGEWHAADHRRVLAVSAVVAQRAGQTFVQYLTAI